MTGSRSSATSARTWSCSTAIDAIDLAGLSDAELRSRVRGLRARPGRSTLTVPIECRPLPEVFAVAREASARLLGHAAVRRPAGRRRGACTAAVWPSWRPAKARRSSPSRRRSCTRSSGRGVHIFTANDYLARRDAEWMAPLYEIFGLRCAFVIQGMTPPRNAGAPTGGRHLRHRQGGGLRLPARSHALDPSRVVHRGARPRDRRRSGLHPDRRGASPARHRRTRARAPDRYTPRSRRSCAVFDGASTTTPTSTAEPWC